MSSLHIPAKTISSGNEIYDRAFLVLAGRADYLPVFTPLPRLAPREDHHPHTGRVVLETITRESLLHFIRTGLEKHSLGVKALEDEAGVSRDSVRDFLRGKTYIMRADKLQKVLRVLNPDLKPFN